MRMKLILSLTVFMAVRCLLFAQNAEPTLVSLSLEEVMEIAGANNLDIQLLDRQEELARANQAQAGSWMLPSLYLGASTHNGQGAFMNTDGRIFREITQRNFWGGVGLDLSWDLASGIYSAREARFEAEAMHFQNQAEKNKTILTVIYSYIDLQVAQASYDALVELVNEAAVIAEQLETEVAAGRRYKSEALLARSNEKQIGLELRKAELRAFRNSLDLVYHLNLGDSLLVQAREGLLALTPIQADETRDLEEITRSRPEYQSLNFKLQALSAGRREMSTGLLLPSIRVNTWFAAFGDQFSPLDPTSVLQVGLGWDFPLDRIFVRGEAKRYDAQIHMQETQKLRLQQQVSREIRGARQEMQLAGAQLEVAREAMELAREALVQSIERQKLRTAQPFEVFQAQEFYTRSLVAYFETIALYNKAQFSLWVAVGNNF